MRFSDITQYTSWGNYQVNQPLKYLKKVMNTYMYDYGLIVNPDFQRGHVWDINQQQAYIEFFLKKGKTGRIIFFNDPNWLGTKNYKYKDFVLVDGLQRITALLAFLDNKIKAFNFYYKDYEDSPSFSDHSLLFNVNNLQTKAEVLQWYIDLNSGGVVHSEEEIQRVKGLLEKEKAKNER